MKHAKIKAAEDEREQLEEEINSLRTDLKLARSNTKIYGEKERGNPNGGFIVETFDSKLLAA